MSTPQDDTQPDPQQQLRKRARRRLVGSVALVMLAAVVLPMVMDQAPQSPVQDVQVRIPGQESLPPLNPPAVAGGARSESVSAVAAADKPPVAEKPASSKPAEKPADKPPTTTPATNQAATDKQAAKPVDKPADKPSDKPAAKPAEKPAEKPVDKPQERTPDRNRAEDARRAEAILAGKAPGARGGESAAPAGGEHVILIGAFSNPANVKQLQSKLGELGIKVYTESFDSPQGSKTRVRAGPFPNRDAADKALEKMKKIGVNGVVAAR